MKKRVLCLLCAISMIFSCLHFEASATSISNIEPKLEKTRASIAAELSSNKFDISTFKQENKNLKKIKSVDSKVIFDYTSDENILTNSLTEPTDVYCEETRVRYATSDEENVVNLFSDASVVPSTNALASVTTETENIIKKTTRTYGGYSITFTSTIVCKVIPDYYYDDEDKYIDIYYANSAKIASSSVYNSAYVRTLDLNLTQFGWGYYPDDEYYSVSKDASYTFLQNYGISKSITNSSVGYVYLGTGSASGVGSLAEMYIIWQTGPGATDGDYYNLANTEGPGNPY